MIDDDDFLDDRPEDMALTEFGVDPDVRQEQGQEVRIDIERATGMMADDRENVARGIDDAAEEVRETGLEEFGGGVRDDDDLFSF